MKFKTTNSNSGFLSITKLFYGLCMLLFFLLPFNGKIFQLFEVQKNSNSLSLTLLLILVFSFFVPGWNGKQLLKNKVFWLFTSLFLFYFLSATFLSDATTAFKELSKKLSFIAIPLLIISNPTFFNAHKKKLFTSYLCGVFFIVLYFDVRALLFFAEKGSIPLYGKYTLFTHPTYLGVNVLIAFVFFLSFFIKSRKGIKHYSLRLLVAYLLLAHLFLILSKAVLIAAIVVFVAFAIYLFAKNRRKFSVYLLMGLIPCVLVFISFRSVRVAVKEAQSRFRDLENYDRTDGSTSFRFQIVKGTPEILGGNFVTGLGVGQEESVLLKYYKKQNWEAAFSKKYNSHNQFLQIGLSVGLIGVLLFVYILIFPLFQIRFNGDKVILVCFVILFCTEAMLERQAGITLFMIFYCYAFGMSIDKKASVNG